LSWIALRQVPASRVRTSTAEDAENPEAGNRNCCIRHCTTEHGNSQAASPLGPFFLCDLCVLCGEERFYRAEASLPGSCVDAAPSICPRGSCTNITTRRSSRFHSFLSLSGTPASKAPFLSRPSTRRSLTTAV